MSHSACLESVARSAPVKAELRGEMPAKQPAWLTVAVNATLHAQRGTVKGVALALGVPDKRVYEVADINGPRPLPASWIPAICRETQSYAVLDALEAQVGRVAVPLPTVDPMHADFYEQAGRLAERVGVTLQRLPEILRDGRITALENALFAADGRQLMADMAELIEMVDAKAKQDAER